MATVSLHRRESEVSALDDLIVVIDVRGGAGEEIADYAPTWATDCALSWATEHAVPSSG